MRRWYRPAARSCRTHPVGSTLVEHRMNIPVHTLSDVVTKHVMPSALATEALPLLIQELGADNGSLMLLSEGRVVHKVLAARDSFAEVAEHRVHAVLTEVRVRVVP